LDDIEKKEQFVLERTPSLKIDWGKDRVLTEDELNRVVSAFASMPGPDRRDKHDPYNFYAAGLNFMALNDVHWQCEVAIVGNFLFCLRELLAEGGRWTKGMPFEPVFAEVLTELVPQLDERQRYIELCRAYDRGSENGANVTLGESAFIAEGS